MALREIEPTGFDEAALTLATAAAGGEAVRIVGGGTKLGWGTSSEPEIVVRTGSLDQICEHNVGDLTAVLQAGVPLARAQEQFASEGQMLALDPPFDPDRRATIGGVFATGDCGPLRHRYGAPRDLILGITVALSDGTIARAGGKVIKNVAGYDLAKLFTGSFGTLGLILSVSVRLHPVPVQSVTAVGTSSDPGQLASAAHALARAPLELEALDVAWRRGRGGLLAQIGGAEALRRTERVAALMAESGLEDVEILREDASLWARQRAGQRSQELALVRIAARPTQLGDLFQVAEAVAGTLVGRASLGTCYLELEPDAAAVRRLRGALPVGAIATLLDAPAELRGALDPWDAQEGPALELMRRVKARFDPARACNPGLFVGGI